MKLSTFSVILASSLTAFTSASSVLDHVDTKGLKKDIVDELKRDLDDCDKKENNRDDYLDCVDNVLDDFNTDEVKRSIKRDIRSEARKTDKKDDKKGPGGPGHMRKLLRSSA